MIQEDKAQKPQKFDMQVGVKPVQVDEEPSYRPSEVEIEIESHHSESNHDQPEFDQEKEDQELERE